MAIYDSPTINELNLIFKAMLNETKKYNFDGVDLYNFSLTHPSGGKSHGGFVNITFNQNTQKFHIEKALTPHWNKLFSLLYWSQHFDVILFLDDDAFIGNYKLSLDYFLNDYHSLILSSFDLSNNNDNGHNYAVDTFLVLPYDYKSLMYSNFAFIINTKNKTRSNAFILDWLNARKVPYEWFDQGSMYYAVMQFYKREIDMSELGKKCIDFCSTKCILCRKGCWVNCYQIIFGSFQRPTITINRNEKKPIIYGLYNITISKKVLNPALVIPNVNKNNMDLMHLNYHNIYPFSMNLLYLNARHYIDHEDNVATYNKSLLMEIYQHLMEHTFLIHYRVKGRKATHLKPFCIETAIKNIPILN